MGVVIAALAWPTLASAARLDRNDVVSVSAKVTALKTKRNGDSRLVLTRLGPVLTASTDGKKAAATKLTAKSFNRSLHDIGLGSSPTLHLVRHPTKGKAKHFRFKVLGTSYDSATDALYIDAKPLGVSRRTSEVGAQAAGTYGATATIGAADTMASGTMSFTFWLAPEVSIVTTVFTDQLNLVDLTISTGSVPLFETQLSQYSPSSSLAYDISFAPSSNLSILQGSTFILMTPSALQPGAVIANLQVSVNGSTEPFSSQIASWSLTS